MKKLLCRPTTTNIPSSAELNLTLKLATAPTSKLLSKALNKTKNQLSRGSITPLKLNNTVTSQLNRKFNQVLCFRVRGLSVFSSREAEVLYVAYSSKHPKDTNTIYLKVSPWIPTSTSGSITLKLSSLLDELHASAN
jgi:DNA-directed RNA polymerase subunit L